MKKRISLLLVFAILVSSTILTLTAFGAEGIIETPKVPLNPSVTEKAKVTVELASDAKETVIGGETIVVGTEFTDIPKDRVSTATITYNYSDSFTFNNDVVIKGVSGASVTNITDNNGVLKIGVNGLSSTSSPFALEFSFKLIDKPEESASISLKSVSAKSGKDKDIVVSYREKSVSFTTETVVPEFSNLGAALRINNDPALRFGLRVEKDAEYVKAMGGANFSYSADNKMQFGMLTIQKSELIGELTVDTNGAHNEVFKAVLAESSSEIVFAYTIENFAPNTTINTTAYVIRPYVSYKTESGDTIYYYGEVKERTAKFIAEIELQSETDTKKINLLNKFTK